MSASSVLEKRTSIAPTVLSARLLQQQVRFSIFYSADGVNVGSAICIPCGVRVMLTSRLLIKFIRPELTPKILHLHAQAAPLAHSHQALRTTNAQLVARANWLQ